MFRHNLFQELEEAMRSQQKIPLLEVLGANDMLAIFAEADCESLKDNRLALSAKNMLVLSKKKTKS